MIIRKRTARAADRVLYAGCVIAVALVIALLVPGARDGGGGLPAAYAGGREGGGSIDPPEIRSMQGNILTFRAPRWNSYNVAEDYYGGIVYLPGGRGNISDLVQSELDHIDRFYKYFTVELPGIPDSNDLVLCAVDIGWPPGWPPGRDGEGGGLAENKRLKVGL